MLLQETGCLTQVLLRLDEAFVFCCLDHTLHSLRLLLSVLILLWLLELSDLRHLCFFLDLDRSWCLLLD